MTITVFVTEIVQKTGQGTLVRACNGGQDGPPLFIFKISQIDDLAIRIGQKITLTAEFGS